MRKKAEAKETIRVTLDLTKEFYERLEALERVSSAASKASVLRDALRVYEFMVKHTLKGDRFVWIDRSGQERDIVLLGAGLEDAVDTTLGESLPEPSNAVLFPA